jgi:hypothetical protein
MQFVKQAHTLNVNRFENLKFQTFRLIGELKVSAECVSPGSIVSQCSEMSRWRFTPDRDLVTLYII